MKETVTLTTNGGAIITGELHYITDQYWYMRPPGEVFPVPYPRSKWERKK